MIEYSPVSSSRNNSATRSASFRTRSRAAVLHRALDHLVHGLHRVRLLRLRFRLYDRPSRLRNRARPFSLAATASGSSASDDTLTGSVAGVGRLGSITRAVFAGTRAIVTILYRSRSGSSGRGSRFRLSRGGFFGFLASASSSSSSSSSESSSSSSPRRRPRPRPRPRPLPGGRPLPRPLPLAAPRPPSPRPPRVVLVVVVVTAAAASVVVFAGGVFFVFGLVGFPASRKPRRSGFPGNIDIVVGAGLPVRASSATSGASFAASVAAAAAAAAFGGRPRPRVAGAASSDPPRDVLLRSRLRARAVRRRRRRLRRAPARALRRRRLLARVAALGGDGRLLGRPSRARSGLMGAARIEFALF